MIHFLSVLQRMRFPRRIDVLVIRSRHGHFLPELVAERRSMIVDPTAFPLIFSASFIFQFLRFRKKVSRLSRYALAIAKSTHARIILATDAIEELTEIATNAQASHVLAVMHGLYIDQSGNNLREQWKSERQSPVTLFSFGEYDISHYRRWGNVHETIIPVGSANNCLYLSKRGARLPKKYEICLVQGALNPFPTDELSVVRLRNWELIAQNIQNLSSRHDVSVVVALNSSSKETQIREWFETRLSNASYVSSSVNRFATYEAIDSSFITFGEASTSLVEGLARRNRCLAVNFSDIGFLSLPLPELLLVRDPNFDFFEQKYLQLRNMDEKTLWGAIESELEKIIVIKNQGKTIETITRRIDEMLE
jgi:hypothetical protein